MVLGALLMACTMMAQEQETVEPQDNSFESIVTILEQYDGKGGASLMKAGRMAMTMGKTIGRAGSAWTKKVAKAFKRVNTVYLLEYSGSRIELRNEIESNVLEHLDSTNLVLRQNMGELVLDETYGTVSEDGKHVSNAVIIIFDQSVVALKGTILSSDVERIVRRLNKQM